MICRTHRFAIFASDYLYITNIFKKMMLMKKIFFSLLGAMTTLTVGAQQQLLSTYTVDPVTNEKTWQCDYTYENGLPTEEHDTYYYAEGNVESKRLHIYDDQGRQLRFESYDMRDGEYVMTTKQENLEWNEDGLATSLIYYIEDENNPGQLILAWKYIFYRYNGVNPADYDVYIPDGAGGWEFYASIRGEDNSKGELVKLYQEIPWGDIVYTSTKLYEYDDHSWLTKETYTSDAWGNYEYTYENFYDANGVTEKRNRYRDGQLLDTQYYVWSDPSSMRTMKAGDADTPWHDLFGRRLGVPPTKGVFIHNGRKVLRTNTANGR